jgi:hypothetical protein
MPARRFYVAAARRSDPPVPDVPGLEAVRWRWIAAEPWWYFEAENELAGATAAPAAYPNGVRLDSPCVNPWQEVTGG